MQSSKKRKILACACVRVRTNSKFRVRVRARAQTIFEHACTRVRTRAWSCACEIDGENDHFSGFFWDVSTFVIGEDASSWTFIAKTKWKLFKEAENTENFCFWINSRNLNWTNNQKMPNFPWSRARARSCTRAQSQFPRARAHQFSKFACECVRVRTHANTRTRAHARTRVLELWVRLGLAASYG